MNLMKTLHALVLAIFVLAASIEAVAQTVTFSTGDFFSSEWSSVISGTGSSVATTETSGGNTGAYRRVSLTVAPNQSVANRQYWSVAVCNPGVQGAITSVSLSYDLSRVFTSVPGATQIAKGIAVQQDGVIFVSSQGVSTVAPPSWESFSVSNIVPLFPGVNWTNGRQITFGFFDSVSSSATGFTIDGGYDNFRVTINFGAVVPPKLYSVDRDSALLREINPDTAATLSSKAITLAGKTVTGATGLATDPVSGKMYALLRITPFVQQSPSVRELVTIDPNTGVATDIGPANNGTSLAFSDLAFAADGTLYGVTGDSSATPETMFTLNKTNAAATFFKTLGNGDDGETIAFNSSDGLIYHASGQNENHLNPPPSNFIFETINPAAPASPVSPVPLSGATIDEATALVYSSGDTFLWADLNFEFPLGRLLRVTKTGSATLLGSLDHSATGLAFFPPAACTYSITVVSHSFAASGGTGTVSVTAGTGCTWTATSNASFVTITSGASGTGNGTVGYSVAANTGTSSRSGTLTLAGLAFTINQQSPGPPVPSVSVGGVVNNASFAPSPAPVAPGSIAAVFGANLNDGSSVQFSSYGPDGKLVTSLGGASAAINNIPAPMFYSFPGQLGVQIPFELAGQTTGTIVVTVGGQSSVPRTVNLDAFAPGVFTVNQQGTGIAAVLHQDGITPVTAQNPAHPNEVVVFFVTGLGAVTPALATGAQSVGNRTVTTPTVMIDGVLAVLDFSGAAPGFVGLNQINLRIPASTRTASNIPVVITIGGKQSNSVTIPVGP